MTTPVGGPLQKLPLSMPPLSPQIGPAAGPTGESQFQNLLIDSLKQTASAEQAAQAAIEQSLVGGDITQVEVFSAVKKADLALRMMLQIRNKLLEAFDEVKQMQM
jgi:flagellar hook-basal body complex protein FliE